MKKLGKINYTQREYGIKYTGTINYDDTIKDDKTGKKFKSSLSWMEYLDKINNVEVKVKTMHEILSMEPIKWC